MLDPQMVADTAVETMSSARGELYVFWHHACRDREELCKQLRGLLKGRSIVPIRVPGGFFDVPNDLFIDIRRLIEANREGFVDLSPYPADSPIGVILLSRTELDIQPQDPSAVRMPDWMPRIGGLEVYPVVRDLTYSDARVMLNDRRLALDSLKVAVYSLEKAIVERIMRIHRADPRHAAKLDGIWRPPCKDEARPPLCEYLSTARDYLEAVEVPDAYRVSAKEESSFFSLAVRHYAATSPDRLTRSVRALAEALGIAPEEDIPDSLALPFVAVLHRPTAPDQPGAARWLRGVLEALISAYQLCNADAHAGDYPKYPFIYLRYTIDDLTTYLERSARIVKQLAG